MNQGENENVPYRIMFSFHWCIFFCPERDGGVEWKMGQATASWGLHCMGRFEEKDELHQDDL